MGNTYGDAWIDLLYDLCVEVRQTNPSKEVQKVSKINPKKYLFHRETKKIFPGEFLKNCNLVGWEEKINVFQKPVNPNLNEFKVNQLYYVTLVKRIFQVSSGLKQDGIKIRDCVNYLYFDGEFEKKLAEEKATFLSQLELLCGVKPDERTMYHRLAGANPNF